MAEGGEKRSPTAHRTPGQIKRHGRTYQARPSQRKNRAKRNAARAKLMKQGRVRRGDGKHVDHKKPMSKGGGNSSKNLQVLSRRANLRKGKS
jgi:5-methylcytosine-specific restriction endonuclease McrA